MPLAGLGAGAAEDPPAAIRSTEAATGRGEMGVPRFGKPRGKKLGGEAPRRRTRWSRNRGLPPSTPPVSALAVLAVGLFVMGGVAGYATALDREIRGGILRQRAEAAQRPDWVELPSLPRYVPEAFLAVVEAELLASSEMRAPARGPSLARELVRQVHLIPSSIAGQSRERMMAPVLEQRLSRSELLELYLNRVYLGRAQGYPLYGIYHASREYFEKLPEDLTLGEAATLAALLLQPRIEDPAGRVGAVGVRRNEVLQVMLLARLITADEYRAAMAEPLGFQPGLEQMPMSRPADWVEPAAPIRLPPAWRPSPTDSTTEERS